jgi:membrane peptidoglycan carboxypeptidase
VVEDGTGTEAGLGPSRPSAGKTGTTDGRYAAWFVGYTPNMAGAVWVGDPAHERQMVNIVIGGERYPKVFGGRVPGPIWRDMMTGALEGKPRPYFNKVYLPEDRPERDRGDDDNDGNGNNDDNGNGDNRGNGGGFIGGADGGNTFPTPEFSFPENFIQGQTNGGNNGNGNGGRFG